jgi:hypothetical protein
MQQLQGMIGQLATVLSGMIKTHPEDLTSLPAAQQKQVQDMLAQAQTLMPQQQGKVQ